MTIKISQLPSLTTVYGNVLLPVVSNVAGTWTTVRSNVAQLQTYILGTVNTDLANLTANAAVQDGQISTLTANAAVQHGQIITANTNMKGYVDGQISTTSSVITTANTNMKGYVDGQDSAITSAWTANAGIQSVAIASNATAITTANTNMTGYADAITTAWTANAGAQHDDITTLFANAASQHNSIIALDGNVTIAQGNISSLTIAVEAGNVRINSINSILANSLTFTHTTISSNTAIGIQGDTAYDGTYIYFCIASNSWIRTLRDAW
jgi:hypothetical protein